MRATNRSLAIFLFLAIQPPLNEPNPPTTEDALSVLFDINHLLLQGLSSIVPATILNPRLAERPT